MATHLVTMPRAGRPLQDLHDAILESLLTGGMLSDDTISRLLGDPADADQESGQSQLEQLIQQIIERMAQEGYITTEPGEFDASDGVGGGFGPDSQLSRFEITDKSLDFLGYRALRDLLGSVGRGSNWPARHPGSRDWRGSRADRRSPMSSGTRSISMRAARSLNAVSRLGHDGAQHGSVDVQYSDLMVAQGEYQSSCATVLMLDCSHSMILYREDRFTPAKQVALALTNLIRHQYPGDALNVVLFHDSAEEIPVKQLARTRVGPYYTNTREGLRLARRILERQQKDMRQIIMITDGKPSALTQPDGRIYRNAFGLDPHIIAETFAEVANCRKAGIMIQHVHAGSRLRARQFRPTGRGHLSRQGLLHDAAHPRAVRADGLHEQGRRERCTSVMLPLFPLPNVVLFPNVFLPLHIFEGSVSCHGAECAGGGPNHRYGAAPERAGARGTGASRL